jgi:hypothetical protein
LPWPCPPQDDGSLPGHHLLKLVRLVKIQGCVSPNPNGRGALVGDVVLSQLGDQGPGSDSLRAVAIQANNKDLPGEGAIRQGYGHKLLGKGNRLGRAPSIPATTIRTSARVRVLQWLRRR